MSTTWVAVSTGAVAAGTLGLAVQAAFMAWRDRQRVVATRSALNRDELTALLTAAETSGWSLEHVQRLVSDATEPASLDSAASHQQLQLSSPDDWKTFDRDHTY
jgi:hypothetical protein